MFASKVDFKQAWKGCVNRWLITARFVGRGEGEGEGCRCCLVSSREATTELPFVVGRARGRDGRTQLSLSRRQVVHGPRDCKLGSSHFFFLSDQTRL